MAPVTNPSSRAESFDVVVPRGALSEALRSHIEANAAALGLQVEVPLRTTASGDWLAARGVERRSAQALRRQLQGLGIEARVAAASTHDEPMPASATVVTVAPPAPSPPVADEDLVDIELADADGDDGWGSLLGSGPVQPVSRQAAAPAGLEPSPSRDTLAEVPLELEPLALTDGIEPALADPQDDDESADGLPMLDWFGDETELDEVQDAVPAARPAPQPAAVAASAQLEAAMSSVVDQYSTPASATPVPARKPASSPATPLRTPSAAAPAPTPPRRVARTRPVPRLDDERDEVWKRVILAFLALGAFSTIAFVLHASWDVPESDAGSDPIVDGRAPADDAPGTGQVTVSSGVAGVSPRTTAERARAGDPDPDARPLPAGLSASADAAPGGGDEAATDRAEARALLQEARGRCQVEEFRACELTAEAAITLDPTLDAAYDLLLAARAGRDRAEREAAGEDVDGPELPREPRVIIVSPDQPRPSETDPDPGTTGDAVAPALQPGQPRRIPPSPTTTPSPGAAPEPTETKPEPRPLRDPLGGGPLPTSPEELRRRTNGQ